MALRAATGQGNVTNAKSYPSSTSKPDKERSRPGGKSSPALPATDVSKSNSSEKSGGREKKAASLPPGRKPPKKPGQGGSKPGQTTGDGNGAVYSPQRSADEHKKMGEDPQPRPLAAAYLAKQPQPESRSNDFIDSGKTVEALMPGTANGIRPDEDGKNEKSGTTPVPTCTKIVYCLPTVSTLPIIVLLAAYGNSLYELCGAELSLISACIAGARSLDVITDPAMSYITDSFESRWGRRKPFLATGCWVYGLSLFLLLMPPYGSSGLVGAWFGMMYILYFLTNTYTTIPYDALAPELTDDSEDRSKLFFISGIFDGLGTLTAVGMPAGLEMMVRGMSINDDICRPSGNSDNVDSLCQAGKTCEEFITDSSKPFVAWASQSESDVVWLLSSNLTNLTGVCDEAANIQNYYVDLIDAHSDFCICRRDCASACSLANKRTGFALVGAIFGIYFILTILGVIGHVKERKPQVQRDNEDALQALAAQGTQGTELTEASSKSKANLRRSASVPVSVQKQNGQKRHPPIVPLLMTTLFNKAFTVLLPAWACDGMVNAIVAALLTYYIRYVVAPEYQTLEEDGRDCAKGVNGMSGAENYSYYCSTEMVLAGCCCTLFVFAAAATPVWLILMNFIGKINTWLLWSCVMAVTNILLIIPSKGDIIICAIVCGCNGLPLGAKFLADAILADIIDYDEFLTGSRREATYTMFKSFLPKIMAIPSIAIPISLMNAMGHVAPVNGMIQEQPDSVPLFLKLVGAVLTCLVSILAFLLKRRFPLKTQEQVDAVAAGIEAHKRGEHFRDPISGLEFMYTSFTEEELPFVWDLDHFFGSSVIQDLQTDYAEGIKKLQKKSMIQLACAIALWFCSFVIAIICLTVLNLMSNDSWSFIPTLLIVSIGMSVVLIVFCTTRYKAARKLETLERYEFGPTDRAKLDEMLARIYKQRKDLEELNASYPEVPTLAEDAKTGFATLKRKSQLALGLSEEDTTKDSKYGGGQIQVNKLGYTQQYNDTE